MINTTEKSSNTFSKEDEQQPHDSLLSLLSYNDNYSEKSINDNDIEDKEVDDLFQPNLLDFSDHEQQIVHDDNTSDNNINDFQDSDDEENNDDMIDDVVVVNKKEILLEQLSKTPKQIYNLYNNPNDSQSNTIPVWKNAPLKYFDENQSYDEINQSFVKQIYDDMVEEYVQSTKRISTRKGLIYEFVKLNMLRFPESKLVSFVKSTFKNMGKLLVSTIIILLF